MFIALRVPPGSTEKGRSERTRAALADPAWEPALWGSEELRLLCPLPQDMHTRACTHTLRHAMLTHTHGCGIQHKLGAHARTHVHTWPGHTRVHTRARTVS